MVSLLRGAGLFVDHMEKSCSSQFSGEGSGDCKDAGNDREPQQEYHKQ